MARGPSLITTNLDGFGRVNDTQNSLATPIRTHRRYDACGRLSFELILDVSGYFE